MLICKTFVINQAVPHDYGCGVPYQSPRAAYTGPHEEPPFRFRRRTGYDGPTAAYFNKNFKTMPKDF